MRTPLWLKILTVTLALVAVTAVTVRAEAPWLYKTVVAMQEPLPVPAPPGEHRLPPGEFCEHPMEGRPAPKHACECHRVVYDEMCEGAPVEQPVCKSYCKPQDCHCPVACDPTPHDPESQPGEGPGDPSEGEPPQLHAHGC